MIEIIKGYTSNIEEVERLVNDTLAQTGGTVKNVILGKETFYMHKNKQVEGNELIFVIEYDNSLKDWQQLFNYVTNHRIEHKDYLRAFFMLDDVHSPKDRIDKLVDFYKDKSITKALGQYAREHENE